MMNGETLSIKDLPEHLRFSASLTNHPLIMDGKGEFRYRPARVKPDLKECWQKQIPVSEMMQMYRDAGYSVGGFEEVFDVPLDLLQKGWSMQQVEDAVLRSEIDF